MGEVVQLKVGNAQQTFTRAELLDLYEGYKYYVKEHEVDDEMISVLTKLRLLLDKPLI